MAKGEKDTVTFRIKQARKNALDSIAASLDRDRSDVINEAIRAYLVGRPVNFFTPILVAAH